MKRQTTLRAALVALGLLLVSSSASADFYSGEHNGDHLIRREFTLEPNEWLNVQTEGCVGNDDTVIFLLGGTQNGADPKELVNWNDDRDGGYCSIVFHQNFSGSAKTYTILVTTYNADSPVFVTLRLSHSSTGETADFFQIGGFPQRFLGDNRTETLETVAVSGAHGGHPVDTVLYVIDPTSRAVKFDDDSGLRRLSSIPTSLNCAAASCWVIAGTYLETASGGNLAFWSRKLAGTDSDNDGLSNALEQSLISFGRLPSTAVNQKDSDFDGLTDRAELIGMLAAPDILGDDASLVMPWQGNLGGPDPALQDMFIEADWMQDAVHSHQPFAALGADMAAIFSADTAFTGRSIRVHLEVGQNVGHWTGISYGTCAGATNVNFYTIKNNVMNFDPLRRFTHHYVIFAHSQLGGNCAIDRSSGIAELLGNDLLVTPGAANFAIPALRGTFTHELGHNLFLDHNKNDSAAAGDRSCVHSSVMNYRYQFLGWQNAGNALRSFGYSNGTCLSGNSFTLEGGQCLNTCTNRCVPSGQRSPKITCPLKTTGPNAGFRVSNGTCDCDLTEWTAPGASPVYNRLSLAFQGDGDVADGAPYDEDERQAQGEYHHGGQGRRGAMKAAHWRFADRKRAFLENQGLKEGRDFWVNPENGKTYSGH